MREERLIKAFITFKRKTIASIVMANGKEAVDVNKHRNRGLWGQKVKVEIVVRVLKISIIEI